jgi:hypothetical protein
MATATLEREPVTTQFQVLPEFVVANEQPLNLQRLVVKMRNGFIFRYDTNNGLVNLQLSVNPKNRLGVVSHQVPVFNSSYFGIATSIKTVSREFHFDDVRSVIF